jgi:hypothetical protein
LKGKLLETLLLDEKKSWVQSFFLASQSIDRRQLSGSRRRLGEIKQQKLWICCFSFHQSSHFQWGDQPGYCSGDSFVEGNLAPAGRVLIHGRYGKEVESLYL